MELLHIPPADDGRQPTTTPDLSQDGGVIYFDGRSNRKRKVTLRLAAGLEIVEDGAFVDTWPFDAIRRADGTQNSLRLSCVTALPLARLEITEPTLQQTVAARCMSLDAGRERQTWRIAGWSLAAIASILFLVVYGIPLAADRLAPLVPQVLEKRLGDAVDKQVRFIFRGNDCNNADGQAALAILIDKLKTAGGIDRPLEAVIVSSWVPNAFALPGGRVYLLNGLLQKANNVDEIAGVLAHELGHVQHHDNLRHLIQAGGTSFVVGLLFGDVIGGSAMIFATRSLFNASYSRDVERDADTFAMNTMRALGRSPKPMGELLFRVTGAQANKGLDILAGHPLTEERLATMSRAATPTPGPEILSATQWQALKSICRAPPPPPVVPQKR
jgi:Zn-dependent protease with chaperone function